MIEKAFFALIRFEINGDELCEEIKNLILPEMMPALFRLSKRYDLAHLIADGLDKNGLLPDGSEAKKRFLQERNLAVYRYEQMQYEFEQICTTLENAKIEFIPLKGAVIRQYFPEPWMRTSCDIDILVKETDLSNAINALEVALNYRYDYKSNHDVGLFAESGVHLELHYKLNDSNQIWDEVLAKAWKYSIAVTDFRYALTNEMFYFYHIAHMAGHFKFGGCGIRPFLDLFLLRKYNTYNQEILENLLTDGGLTAFSQAICGIVDYWFADGEATEIVLNFKEFVLNGGMYGDLNNRVAVAKIKKGGRWKVLFSRIWLPYLKLKFQYPILQKHKILVPFYQVKRWFNLLNKGKRKQAVQELQSTVHQDEVKSARIERLLNDLGL